MTDENEESTKRKLTVKDSQLVLVGTAHVSKESVEEVRQAIVDEKPDIVAVELCEPRYKVLLDKKSWEQTPLTKLIRGEQPYFFLGQSFLAMVQRSLGEELGVEPGSEMLEAIKAAKEIGAEIALVDRKIAVTLRRAWTKMSLREKFRIFKELLYGFFGVSEMSEEIDIEMLKRQDVITEMMEELGKLAPKAKEVLVDERDAYIAGRLRDVAGENPGKKIVGVVGAGHLSGLVENLRRDEETDLSELETIPSSFFSLKLAGYLVPVAFLAVFVWTVFSQGWDKSIQIIANLFWIGGGLSAIGALAALAHPFAIGAAFLAAPFGILNPLIATGWVSGYVQVLVNPPQVKDFQGLREIRNVSTFWKNRLTKVLLVAAFTNIGATAGAVIVLGMVLGKVLSIVLITVVMIIMILSMR
jgi:pheromone shutdown-related protein TraB